jgi:hypothetical protein
MAVNRVARIAAYDSAVAHLVIAYHGDGTITTLCSEEHVQYSEAPEGTRLCQHCVNVRKELNAVQ